MQRASKRQVKMFLRKVRIYYRAHGRDFPWRRTRDPYKILVSEVMLQQTQTDRVLGKYEAFLGQFPGFRSLAKAPAPLVLKAWQGLGYNRRALYLKRTAEIVVRDRGGELPQVPELLRKLPGVGAGTAGALMAFVFNKPAVFIETNIRRAYIHHFFSRKRRVRDGAIAGLIKATLDEKNPRDWYWALMDYGAMLGRREKENPNRRSRHYARQSKFEGSLRQIRGRILRILLAKRKVAAAHLEETIGSDERLALALAALKKEGFIGQTGDKIYLAQ